MHREVLTQSIHKRPVEAWRLTQGPVNLLLMAGVHGDEPEGYYLIERYVKDELWKDLEGRATLWVIPRLNPDGCAEKTRGNGNGVDLNRNMPTQDWSPIAAKPRYNPGSKAASEPETLALMSFIERIQPRVIFSAHSWQPMINYNGPCQKLAEYMSQLNGYRISDDIGYPTPGSLGTWSGWERKIPTITLEIEEESSEETIWSTHAEALKKALIYAATHEDLNQ